MVITATLSRRTAGLNADVVSIIQPPEPLLHRAARRTGGNETKTAAAATQLVQSLGYHSRAGRRKWMAVGDGSAKHVKLTLIHFAGRVGAAQYIAREALACQQLNVCGFVRQRLRAYRSGLSQPASTPHAPAPGRGPAGPSSMSCQTSMAVKA